MTSITDNKYVALTTYRKDGSTKSLPVWITDFGDGTIGFTTASSSYKVKRLRNDPRLMLQPSDARGNVEEGTETVTGTAELKSGSEFARYEAAVKSKYGLQYHGIKLLGRVMSLVGKGSGTDTAVVITPDT